MIENSPSMTTCTTTATVELRQCQCCSLPKPAREYSGSGTTCRRCRSETERLRRRHKRLRTTSCAARQLVQAEDIASIQAVASRLSQRFTPRRLVESFEQLLAAGKPASLAVANAIVGILKIRTLAESVSAKLELPTTIEAQQRALARELSLFVLERPDSAAELLREIGWQVEPPESVTQQLTATL